MTIYVCKSCGRAMKANEKPNYCYADRMDAIENISDEDAVKMRLFSDTQVFVSKDIVFEFPFDVRFDPFTGEKFDMSKWEALTYYPEKGYASLSEFQRRRMEEVCRG